MDLEIRLSRSRNGSPVRPDQVALALLGFAVAAALFLLVPPLLGGQFGSVPGFTGQEAADLLTPLVVIPPLVLAIELTGRSGLRTRLILVALIAAWAAGQGMHLGANAMGDVFKAGPARDAFYATPVGNLDHFLDEVLSHWIWHLAWVGLLVVLLLVGIRGAEDGTEATGGTLRLAGLAGALHGFTWFCVTDEGGTWALAIPATLVLLLVALLVRRRDGSGRVIGAFLIVSSVLALALYVTWIAYAGWPPQSLFDRFVG